MDERGRPQPDRGGKKGILYMEKERKMALFRAASMIIGTGWG
jgi:hypothetical protein